MSILISKRSALSLLLSITVMYGASEARTTTVPVIVNGHPLAYSFNSSISNFGAATHGNMVFIPLRFIALKLSEPVSFNPAWKTMQVRGITLKIFSTGQLGLRALLDGIFWYRGVSASPHGAGHDQ